MYLTNVLYADDINYFYTPRIKTQGINERGKILG
jgi:hypothetical protein